MAKNNIQSLFNQHTVWSNPTPMFFYQLIWQKLDEEGLIDNTADQNPLISYLYGCVLIDLYRQFNAYIADEYWSLDEFNDCNDQPYDYEKLCELLNIQPLTIEDFYTEEEIIEEALTNADIQEILEEERPTFSDFFAEYVQTQYRQKAFAALKKHYNLSDIFALMANTFAHDRYESDYWMEDEEEAYESCVEVIDIESFVESTERNKEHILNDMEFIPAYEWLSTIY